MNQITKTKIKILGGCVKDIENDKAPHLKQKICYCKGDNCNSAIQNNETNFYLKMSIIIFNLLLAALIQ